ncbi:MAG: lysophospholipid acyltransferase family protein [bacterium]
MINLINKIRTYYKLFLAVIVVIYFAIKVQLIYIFSKDKRRYWKNSTKWGTLILKVFNINVEIAGLEKLDKNTTYIFASNHQSLLDIPILFYSLQDFNYVIMYKKELEKIFLFGRNMKISPFIAVDRADPRNAMASIETTLKQMKENDCPVIFPEGTRSLDGKLANFKRGAFLLASRSKMPIVPIAIIGSSDVLPKGTLKIKTRSTVKVVFNAPVENDKDMDRNDERELMNKVHTIIKSSIEENS